MDNSCDASKGLTSDVWCQMIQAGTVSRVRPGMGRGVGEGRGRVQPLSGLVHHRIFPIDKLCDASKGLTGDVWYQMIQAGTVSRVGGRGGGGGGGRGRVLPLSSLVHHWIFLIDNLKV